VRVVIGFVDAIVNQLLDLDSNREVALSLVPLGRASDSSVGPPPAIEPLNLETVPLSGTEVDYPTIRAMHSASSLITEEEARVWRGLTPTVIFPEPSGQLFPLEPYGNDELPHEPIERVILRRGSTRQFARESITFRQFSTMIYRATQGIPADFFDPVDATLNDLYLIVNAVDGLPPGAYVFRRDKEALELLKEEDSRDEAGYLGLGQEIPADGSADVFFLADLKPILERFGNRGYRAAQLEAGIIGGKLYLSAYGQGLGASGLTFYDDDVTEFFSPHAKGKSVMFLVALGKSVKRKVR
jgi:SagB-type dehydrogenase family enzyme